MTFDYAQVMGREIKSRLNSGSFLLTIVFGHVDPFGNACRGDLLRVGRDRT